MAWMGPVAGGRMANPIAHEVDMLLGDVGEVVGEVPVDDGEDEPAMEPVQVEAVVEVEAHGDDRRQAKWRRRPSRTRRR